jgi:hypothetical protein
MGKIQGQAFGQHRRGGGIFRPRDRGHGAQWGYWGPGGENP